MVREGSGGRKRPREEEAWGPKGALSGAVLKVRQTSQEGRVFGGVQ